MKKMVRGGALFRAVCLAFSAVGAAMPAEADVVVPQTVSVERRTVVATPTGGMQTIVAGRDDTVTTLLCEVGVSRIAVSRAEEVAAPFALPVDALSLVAGPVRLSLDLPLAEATGDVAIRVVAAGGGSRTFAAQPASGQLMLTLADGETAILTAT